MIKALYLSGEFFDVGYEDGIRELATQFLILAKGWNAESIQQRQRMQYLERIEKYSEDLIINEQN